MDTKTWPENQGQNCNLTEITSKSIADWRDKWQRDERHIVLANLANAAHALRAAPQLQGLVAYDEFACHAMLRRSVPGSRSPAVMTPRPLTDGDVSAVQEWLQKVGLSRLGREVAAQAVNLVARENGFHPVQQYLTALRWDDIPRLEGWLVRYVGAEPSAYISAVGSMSLIAMVARIMKPGSKADYMLVLEGPQGAHKSTVCKILGGKWFSDSLPDISRGQDKDVAMHMNGKWVIEIAEMSALSKAETQELKAFLARDTERFRPPYGREEIIVPRQCVFIGTTNQNAYLRDETGGRRFWPVAVGAIDIDALARDRDQILAEAVAAFNNGAKWWPDQDFERQHIAPEQADRFDEDVWQDLVEKWLEGKQRCTIVEVATSAIGLSPEKIGTNAKRRIVNILVRLGWDKRKTSSARFWERR